MRRVCHAVSRPSTLPQPPREPISPFCPLTRHPSTAGRRRHFAVPRAARRSAGCLLRSRRVDFRAPSQKLQMPNMPKLYSITSDSTIEEVRYSRPMPRALVIRAYRMAKRVTKPPNAHFYTDLLHLPAQRSSVLTSFLKVGRRASNCFHDSLSPAPDTRALQLPAYEARGVSYCDPAIRSEHASAQNLKAARRAGVAP